MAQVALYRKYRSQTFEDLIGQDHVVRTLQSALSSGRTAQAFLFTGPRGTGKTSSARLLAKCLNCEKGPTPTPCNVCSTCKEITAGSSPDVIEIDAASEAGVDDVREKIVDAAQYQPMMSPYKVFIIDEVHDLSAKAFDALLKTIEEPPSHVVFILATTEYNKVPPTIRSRCQKFEFHRATLQNLIDRLNFVCQSEGVEADISAISAIARMADGGYRDALTLLEQAMLVSGGKITLDVVYDQLGLINEDVVDSLLLAIKSADVASLLTQLEAITRTGRDPRAILESLLHRLADLTRASYQVPSAGADATREAALHELSTRLGQGFLVQIRSSLSEAHKVIRDISLPRLWLESELVRLAAHPAPVATSAPAQARPAAAPKPTIAQELSQPPVAAPKPVVEAPVAAAPPVDPAATQPAEVEREPVPMESAGDIWTQLYSKIPSMDPKTGGTPPIKVKLKEATLKEDLADRIVVDIGRAMFLDWVNEPKKIGYLQKLLAELGRPDTRIEFVVEKKNERIVDDVQAVELPLEGARLEKAVRDIFGLNQDGEENAPQDRTSVYP